MECRVRRYQVSSGVLKVLGLLSFALACNLATAATQFSVEQLSYAEKIRETAAKENLAYTILESLTTEVGPRMAGSPGDAKAVAWAQAKFKRLGFDKVWLEPVTYPVWQRGAASLRLTAPFQQEFQLTALGLSGATDEQGLQAELVAFNDLQALRNASPAQVRGKIVYIGQRMASSRDYGQLSAIRTRGPALAAQKGAAAFILRSIGTDSHRFAHTGVTDFDKTHQVIPAAAISNPDADLLERVIKRGQPVSLQLNLQARLLEPVTSYNVIAEYSGSQFPEQHVLIGGHLDSWDLGTGALDDGAGCAITMAAVESLIRLGQRPKRSIRVVLFANEEYGLIGGDAYFKAHQLELHKIQAAAEADAGQGPVISLSAFVKNDAKALVQQMLGSLAPLGVKPGNDYAHPGPDMGVLRDAGVASFALRLQADDYFNFHHTADDTFDKVELKRITQASAAYAVFAWLAADAPIDFGSASKELKAAIGNK